MDGVVPLPMERVARDVERCHFLIGHNDPLRIGIAIQFAADRKPARGRGGADEVDDHASADERPGLPVHRDKRDQAVLYLVPFARAGRQVMHGDVDAQFFGKTLEFALP